MRNKRPLFLTMAILVFGVSLAKLAIRGNGNITSNAVIPFLMVAVIAEQITPRYSTNPGASALLRAFRVGGFVIALVLLIVSGVRESYPK
jgi:hypothetical protein